MANVNFFVDANENEIPGASLNGRDPTILSIPELKRWLRCREGASEKGRKKELIARFVFYYQYRIYSSHNTNNILNFEFIV